MKKTMALVLACLLALSALTACGGTNDQQSSQTPPVANNTSAGSSSASNNTPAGASSVSSPSPSASASPAPNNAPLSPSPASNAPSSNFNASRPITVVTREEGSGTRDAVRDLFDIKDADGKENVTREAIVADSTGVMMTNVANDPYAIGYCSLASLNDTVKALIINGVAATAENVKSGAYEIQRPFYLATMGEATGLALDFIGFILSREGQSAAARRCIPIDDNAPPYSGNAPSGRLVVGGSSSVAPVMADLITAYKAVNPNADIELQESDSSKGMNDTKSGAYDIGMASRAVREAEIADGLVPVFIAIDGIAVIVNAENPITAMTTEQVKNIYNGEIEIWSGVN